MRIVIFAVNNEDVESTPYWPIICSTGGLSQLLLCRKAFSRTFPDVWRRFRRNTVKHGFISVPYRLAVLIGTILRRIIPGRSHRTPHPTPVPCPVIETTDIHNEECQCRQHLWGGRVPSKNHADAG